MKAVQVKALPDCKLEVSFSDGVLGVIDLKSFIKEGVFSVLQDEQKFQKVYITDYALAWSEELEIDLMTVYAELSGQETNHLFDIAVPHATN